MGIFKHKDKTRPDLVHPAPTTNPTPAQAPTTNNSYNDSAYYSSSNVSSADTQRLSQQQPQGMQGQQPGTTVTTTTTTTTTTVTVGPDGQVHRVSHPYNPSNDPPPQTETIFNPPTQNQNQSQNLAPPVSPLRGQSSGYQPPPEMGNPTPLQSQNSGYQSQHPSYQNDRTSTATAIPAVQTSNTAVVKPSLIRMQTPPRKPTPQQVASYKPPLPQPPTPNVMAPTPQSSTANDSAFAPPPTNPVTGDGRAVPQHLELSPPPRSAKRNSQELNVQPLSPQKSNSPTMDTAGAPHVPPKYDEDVSPMTERTRTPNFSRPGTSSTVIPAPPVVPSTIMTGSGRGESHRLGKREGMMSAFKGLHGAGEALRGTVNSKIAKGMHDSAEEEKQRAIREHGVSEFRGSGLRESAGGLREGLREKAEERRRSRRRSGGAQQPQVGHTLDRVEESSVGV